MKHVHLWNSVWLLSIIAAIVATMSAGRSSATEVHTPPVRAQEGASVRYVKLRDGEQGLADASGQVIPIRPYRRIATCSTVADGLLLALAEPERIAALTRYGFQNHPDSFLWGRRALLDDASNVEKLLRLRIDLLIGNFYASPDVLARAREAGIQVFHLGEMRGLTTFLPNAEVVAALLGDRQRGIRYAESFLRRMRAVAADVPQRARKTALYVSAHAGQLFAAGERTSYHDVLIHAGLVDLAATRLRDFPQLDPEQVLAMDPDVIVTHAESRLTFCAINGLEQLRACRDRERSVVGIRGALISDPGPGMLEAAEELRERVYGPRPFRAKDGS